MATPDRPLAIYAAARANASRMVSDAMAKADTTDSVAATIVRAATVEDPSVRYTSGKGNGTLAMMRRFAPAAMFDKGLRKQMRLPR